MKTSRLTLIALLALVCTSCSTFTVKEGSEPIVVYGEYSTEMARDLFDSFLKFERDNEVVIKQTAPDVHRFANNLRDNGKRWITDVNTAIRTYKRSRTEENKNKLVAVQAILDAVILELRNQSSRVQ